MNVHPASVLGWACFAVGINAIINGWLIHSGLIRHFSNAVQGRAIGSLLLIVPCIFFFDATFLMVDNDKRLVTFLMALLFSLVEVKFNKLRKRSVREARNQAYLLHSTNHWSFHVPEVISWILYLLPYEYLFRGLLLHDQLNRYHPVVAILLNCSLYALVHLQQGRKETAGAFLYGILLCCLTIMTHNFWSAFFIHLAFALSNSFIVVRNNQLTLIKS